METNPNRRPITRRSFIFGAAAVVTGLAVHELRGCSDESKAVPEVDNHFEPGSGEAILNPEVKVRPRNEDFGDADQVDGELSTEFLIRRNAPVFTLIHTVKNGDTASEIASRYFTSNPGTLDNSEIVSLGLKNIKSANNLSDDMMIKEGQTLLIPVSEPVAVRRDGMSLKEISERWGFSVDSIQTLNDEVSDNPAFADWAYLPMQLIPETEKNEELYVLENKEGGPRSYWGIAQELGTGLSTLLARNLVNPTHLEYGHILVVRKEQQDKPTITTTTTLGTTTTLPDNPGDPRDPGNPGDKDGITPEDMIAQRAWTGEIVRTDENDKLEQNISVERMEEIVLTPEGYNDFIGSIDTETLGEAFEIAGTTYHKNGKELIIDDPEFFIIHHTAQGVERGVSGMERLTTSILGNGLSVQWAINQDDLTYRLVTNPKIACNHAYGHNSKSTGVELVTDGSRAQGSVTNEQLASAMYLAYYVVTEVYGKKITEDTIKELIVGHREINDRTELGKRGKPDFFEGAMDKFRERVLTLVEQLS